MTDPNLPEQPGAPVPPPPPPPGPAPAYGAVPPATPAASYPQPAASYPQPATAYGQPPATKTNTLAIVSLVASIAGIVILWGIGSIAAVICGHISLSQIKKTGEQGRGMALAGLIIGYAGIVLAIIGVIVAVALSAWLVTYYGTTGDLQY
ncbi:hypothetical protein J2X63_002415 [Agromyces sp. 3263]|uniref:DUF4190 domain-containing protein n=1 Tax=Agromyces sp. 3263 TaxID=2817750 RepID=UPI00285A28D9|nr:DUF4190 domain-containing protein [Agromyces sp. 3263]MDR6906729.1 hypothetical protein [Agromyces sp. 3263]